MSERLDTARSELRELLRDYSREGPKKISEEDAQREEAEYAGSGLKAEEIFERIKAVEFLEILDENIFAQDHLLEALHDKESSVVLKSVHALGKIATPVIIPKLKNFIQETKSKHLTAEIVKIISKLERKTD